MAAILPDFQTQLDTKQGFIIVISRVTLVSTSDTITVPSLANTNASASSAQLRGANDNAATVTDDGANTITIAGTVGDEVTVVSKHSPQINYGAEA